MKGKLVFEWETADGGDTYMDVGNHKGEYLGEIQYESRWRQYVFMPDYGTMFSWDCLEGIAEKLKETDRDYHDVYASAKELAENLLTTIN